MSNARVYMYIVPAIGLFSLILADLPEPHMTDYYYPQARVASLTDIIIVLRTA